jgi:hypothetical protein
MSDPRISRIEKNLPNICPKFFDLYASIYGDQFDNELQPILFIPFRRCRENWHLRSLEIGEKNMFSIYLF